jgi:hypothetical protein
VTEEELLAQKRAKNAAYVRKSYYKDKERAYRNGRKKNLKRLYGINLDQFNELKSSQNAMCAICGTKEPGGTGEFAVDHCHSTGSVRGLLCMHCNTGLGKFNDNPAALRKAADYLEAAQQ